MIDCDTKDSAAVQQLHERVDQLVIAAQALGDDSAAKYLGLVGAMLANCSASTVELSNPGAVILLRRDS